MSVEPKPTVAAQIAATQFRKMVGDLIKEYSRVKTLKMRLPYKRRDRDPVSAFESAAKLATAECLTAETYIAACFEGCTMAEGPNPNALGGEAAKRWIAQYKFQRDLRHAGRGVIAGEHPDKHLVTPMSDPAADSDELFNREVAQTMEDIRVYLTNAQFSIADVYGLSKLDQGFTECAVMGGMMHCICRPILAGLTREVRRLHGFEIRDYLEASKARPAALEKLDYDINMLWNWLKTGDPL